MIVDQPSCDQDRPDCDLTGYEAFATTFEVTSVRTPKASTLNALHTMQSNKPANTGPELKFRAALRAAGLSGYRVNLAGLPGRPDVAFTRHKLAVFVHGCYWHRCPHCQPVLPRRNATFWKQKLEANTERDERQRKELDRRGWAVIEVWECELDRSAPRCASRVVRWLAARADGLDEER